MWTGKSQGEKDQRFHFGRPFRGDNKGPTIMGNQQPSTGVLLDPYVRQLKREYGRLNDSLLRHFEAGELETSINFQRCPCAFSTLIDVTTSPWMDFPNTSERSVRYRQPNTRTVLENVGRCNATSATARSDVRLELLPPGFLPPAGLLSFAKNR